MATLHEPASRRSILERLSLLRADSNRLWGTMTVDAALAHLADQLRFAVGELTPVGARGPLTRRPVQWLAIELLPWPKSGVPTSRELLQTIPSPSFEDNRRELERLMNRFAAHSTERLGPHPMFGTLPPRLWGRLAFRHLDHHLKQFGV